MSSFDDEWKKPALPFSEAVLKQSGGLTMAGVELYRASISTAIEEGQYKNEAELFYDWTIRPNPDTSTLAFWHSFSHDLWVNSSFYKKQLEDANKAYFDQQKKEEAAAKTVKAGGPNALLIAGGAVVLLLLVVAVAK